jgi:surface carbohydrate biosynthesis protein
LAYEVFGRGKKVAFFNARKCKGVSIESKKFAWPYKVNNKGFFWTDKINYKEISRIFNNLRSCGVNEWKKKSSFLRRMNMTYDFKNKKINILMRKLIMN